MAPSTSLPEQPPQHQEPGESNYRYLKKLMLPRARTQQSLDTQRQSASKSNLSTRWVGKLSNLVKRVATRAKPLPPNTDVDTPKLFKSLPRELRDQVYHELWRATGPFIFRCRGTLITCYPDPDKISIVVPHSVPATWLFTCSMFLVEGMEHILSLSRLEHNWQSSIEPSEDGSHMLPPIVSPHFEDFEMVRNLTVFTKCHEEFGRRAWLPDPLHHVPPMQNLTVLSVDFGRAIGTPESTTWVPDFTAQLQPLDELLKACAGLRYLTVEFTVGHTRPLENIDFWLAPWGDEEKGELFFDRCDEDYRYGLGETIRVLLSFVDEVSEMKHLNLFRLRTYLAGITALNEPIMRYRSEITIARR